MRQSHEARLPTTTQKHDKYFEHGQPASRQLKPQNTYPHRQNHKISHCEEVHTAVTLNTLCFHPAPPLARTQKEKQSLPMEVAHQLKQEPADTMSLAWPSLKIANKPATRLNVKSTWSKRTGETPRTGKAAETRQQNHPEGTACGNLRTNSFTELAGPKSETRHFPNPAYFYPDRIRRHVFC